MCVAVVGAALVLLTVPVSAEPDGPEPGVAPLPWFWEMASDLWSGLVALWAPESEEALSAPSVPDTLSAGQCELGCGEQSHDIDPNG